MAMIINKYFFCIDRYTRRSKEKMLPICHLKTLGLFIIIPNIFNIQSLTHFFLFPLLRQLLSNQSHWLFTVQSLLHGVSITAVFVYREVFVFSGFIFCLLIMIQSVSASLYCDNIHFPFRPAVTQSHCPTQSTRVNISLSHLNLYLSNVFCKAIYL